MQSSAGIKNRPIIKCYVPESQVFLAACLNGAFASISAGSVDSCRLGVLDKGSNWIFSLLSFPGLPFGILFLLFYFLVYSDRSFIRQNRSFARKKLFSLFLKRFVYQMTYFEFVADWRFANYRYFISLLYTRKINVGITDLLPSSNILTTSHDGIDRPFPILDVMFMSKIISSYSFDSLS